MTSTTKRVVASLTSTAKIANLQGDTQQPSGGQGLTTDYGVKISDTDNWSISF
jgi:catalase